MGGFLKPPHFIVPERNSLSISLGTHDEFLEKIPFLLCFEFWRPAIPLGSSFVIATTPDFPLDD